MLCCKQISKLKHNFNGRADFQCAANEKTYAIQKIHLTQKMNIEKISIDGGQRMCNNRKRSFAFYFFIR